MLYYGIYQISVLGIIYGIFFPNLVSCGKTTLYGAGSQWLCFVVLIWLILGDKILICGLE